MANIIVSFGGRDLVPATVIRNEVKDYLNAHFERLKFGKVIQIRGIHRLQTFVLLFDTAKLLEKAVDIL